MLIHVVDGTYELFRHYYAMPSARDEDGREVAAVRGVLASIRGMLRDGATHVGVATDHVIESFRNDLWADYKTGEGIEPALRAQFQPLEDALTALGVTVWPMVELEADDALASAAALAAKNRDVQKVCIWTPDKDLAQCVRGDRIVQVDRKSHVIRNADGVREKFGVMPERIPDYLALVGDASDGYPGISGVGAKGAAGLIDRFGRIEDFPPEILGERKALALLFKRLATLRDDALLFSDVDTLKWQGPGKDFAAIATKLGDPRLVERAEKALHSPKASESRSPTAIALKKKSTKAAKQQRRSDPKKPS